MTTSIQLSISNDTLTFREFEKYWKNVEYVNNPYWVIFKINNDEYKIPFERYIEEILSYDEYNYLFTISNGVICNVEWYFSKISTRYRQNMNDILYIMDEAPKHRYSGKYTMTMTRHK
jgi:hypothetical protein